ncbi:unnamed protein product [Candidula unifasciata]|uniref:Sugar transporter SWEET n=1 Tax=Candidula unifasciata TaxID=100452 RepID=A0A8S4A888_9EUPU|nr:unnamed protein product [Candidula unifasciata]
MALDFVPDLLTVVEASTVLVAFVMMGSGLPICLNMYKRRSTENVPYILFLISVFLSLLGLQYGILMGNKLLILINLAGVVVWGAYTAIFILVSSPKSQPLFRLLAVIGLYLAHLYYLSTLPSTDHLSTVGKYMMVWCLIISIVPAGEIYTIIQTKSTNCCDLSLLCGGTLNVTVWCLYGFLVNDINIYFPTIPGLLISLIKIALLLLYGLPSSQSIREKAPRKESIDAKAINGKSADDTLRQRK